MSWLKYTVLGELIEIVKSGHRKHRWHRLHPDSDTIPMNAFDFSRVSVGKWSYGELNVVDFGGECHLKIGDFVSIAQHVTFILNAEHHLDHISTYPFKVKLLKTEKSESFGKGDIIVDDDAWIGYGSTILSGVHIGQGAVIAAGAVVTKDVPPYAIFGGNPAHLIRYRFSDEIIGRLLRIDFSEVNSNFIKKHMENLYHIIRNSDDIAWIGRELNL